MDERNALRLGFVMTFSDPYDMTIESLTAMKRILVSIGDRKVLDLQVPLRVAEESFQRNLLDLGHLLRTISGEETDGRLTAFRVLGNYAQSHSASTIEVVADAVGAFIKAVSFGLGDPIHEVAYELADDRPTQVVTIKSWDVFALSAQTTDGQVHLRVNYPDDVVRTAAGARPIDEINCFLAAALSWSREALRQANGAVAHQRRRPQAIPDDMCTISYNGNAHYSPLEEEGFSFWDSELRLTVNHQKGYFPTQEDVIVVMRELKERLMECAPRFFF